MTEAHDNQPEERGIVHRFLGSDAAAGGLHALLGLPPRAHDQDAVIRALERQLSRIDAHPQGRTPEADEVRLALHAAAAQLVHQAAHRERSIGKRTGAVIASSPQRRLLQLEQDALLTLARYGGWNRRSLHRLTMLAMARGAQYSDVAKVLQHLAGRRGGGAGPSTNGQPARGIARPLGFEPQSLAIKAADDDPDADGKPLAVIVGAIATGLTLIVAVALVVVAVTSGPSETDADQPETAEETAAFSPADLPMAGGEELFPWQGKPDAPEPDAPVATVPQFDRLSDALAALDSAADGLEIDPAEAARVFDGAFTAVGERWCNLTVPQQRAAQHDVVEFVYRAVQRPALVEPVIGTISRRSLALARDDARFAAKDIWPTAWSVGILARLARERDIGARASRVIEAQLRESVGSTVVVAGGFEQGVTAALWAMLPAMVDAPPAADTTESPDSSQKAPGLSRTGEADTEVWERWIQAARFGSGNAQGTLLAALEWVIVAADEPTESDAARAAIESLTLAIEWGEESPARAWLIRMFGDQRVSIADLHAVSTTLARRSRVQGIDVTMALAVRASTDARTLLRERYAAVWGISTDGPTLDDLAVDWAKAVREAAVVDDTSVVKVLASVASLSRLNQAANLRFLGRLDDAGIVIDEYDRPIEMELTRWSQRQRAGSIDSDPGMARWALSYRSAQRDYPRRLELLTEASRTQFRHPTDAEVLVTEAFRGSPAQARVAARSALLSQRPSAVFTLAILELAPRIPRTPQNADLVSAMTATAPIATDDPDWKLKTRRVLVQTALEQLAAEGDQGVIDRLAAVLGESYAARTMDNAASVSGEAATGTAADRAAAMLRARWDRLARSGGLGAEALEVEAVLARHAARMSLAQGPIQVFAAEQVAAFELMGVVVVSERLDRAADVQAIRARVRRERREAGDIIEQLHAVERGFCELWAVRLGQEGLWE